MGLLQILSPEIMTISPSCGSSVEGEAKADSLRCPELWAGVGRKQMSQLCVLDVQVFIRAGKFVERTLKEPQKMTAWWRQRIACLRILSRLWVSESSEKRCGVGQESHHCWLRAPRPTCAFSTSPSSSPNPDTVCLQRRCQS